MNTRRNFIQKAGLGIASVAAIPSFGAA